MQITTIEGLGKNGRLHLPERGFRLQEAFLEADALQCGYCTSGMIMSAFALLKENANPTPREIASFMEGNICRCGAYSRIIAAISKAARGLRP
jgi:aerobic-type carbon monoxide dehydrogenase small subunit (CoxS/CutS family)